MLGILQRKLSLVSLRADLGSHRRGGIAPHQRGGEVGVALRHVEDERLELVRAGERPFVRMDDGHVRGSYVTVTFAVIAGGNMPAQRRQPCRWFSYYTHQC